MDWQETVIKDIPQGVEPQTTLCRHCAYMAAQAEISFKVGIREVVEWMKENLYISPDKTSVELITGRFSKKFAGFVFEDEWQAKLKEWGIDA